MLHPISRFWRAQPTTQQLANDVSSVLSQKENETIDTLGVYLNKKSVKFLTKKLLHRFWYRAQHDKTTNVKLFMSGLIIVRFPAEALNGNDAVDRNLHDKASTMMDLFTDAAIDPTNTDKIRRFATRFDSARRAEHAFRVLARTHHQTYTLKITNSFFLFVWWCAGAHYQTRFLGASCSRFNTRTCSPTSTPHSIRVRSVANKMHPAGSASTVAAIRPTTSASRPAPILPALFASSTFSVG